MRYFVAFVALAALLSAGCASLVKPELKAQESYLDRLMTGDVPDNPEEAQVWLDGITQQVRMLAVPVRAYCEAKRMADGSYPAACIQVQERYDRLVQIRNVIQDGIELWSAAGGVDSAGASEAFLDLLGRYRPEAQLLLDVLVAWRGGHLEEQPIIQPGA